MARFKDVPWNLSGQDDDATVPGTVLEQALLMDLRDLLRSIDLRIGQIRDIVQCTNFQRIPHTLTRIATNTTRKRKSNVR